MLGALLVRQELVQFEYFYPLRARTSLEAVVVVSDICDVGIV